MKKIYIVPLLALLILTGCEKDYDEVINPSVTGYEVQLISDIDSLDYGLGDSLLYLKIKITPASLIPQVLAITDPPVIISTTLLDNGNLETGDTISGDGIYSGIITLSNVFPSGTYGLNYKISDKLAAKQYFFFENGQAKFPPVISNLNFPDSVLFNETFIFSLLAVDSNGAGDIRRVYYELFRPNGTQVANSEGITQFPMLDDGNSSNESGDSVAGDSIYSFRLTFPINNPSFPAGTYRFEFTAEDKTRRLSNSIIHFLEVL